MFIKIKKVFRYIRIYGLKRTIFKTLGRNRKFRYLKLRKCKSSCNVAVIGCGQFSFSTIGSILSKNLRSPFLDCFDICSNQIKSFAYFYNITSPSLSFNQLNDNDKVKLVYITSNHASHTNYAINLLNSGKDVYIEKPVSVNFKQLTLLNSAITASNNAVYCGYNRPFSKAIKRLKSFCTELDGPISLNCFVTGHLIEKNHWYRNPAEGTRVCGNIGHWLDLAVHILCWSCLPENLRISISYADPLVNDDNITITLTSQNGDLIVITLTSRSEPFEGINETINFQQNNVISKIDDFRSISIWKHDLLTKETYSTKDVGHHEAVLQPFHQFKYRPWEEILRSSALTLTIAEMVSNRQEFSDFSFSKCLNNMNISITNTSKFETSSSVS